MSSQEGRTDGRNKGSRLAVAVGWAKTNSHKVRRMANQCERSTANSVALGIIALLGRSGMDWLYLEQMQDEEWWQLQGWIKRN